MSIVLSASDLQKLQSETRKQMDELNKLIQEVDRAVQNRGWESTAATSFENLWRSQHMKVLKSLHDELNRWLQELKKHESAATDVNTPFR